jgi:hypothetical protein
MSIYIPYFSILNKKREGEVNSLANVKRMLNADKEYNQLQQHHMSISNKMFKFLVLLLGQLLS